MKTIATNQPSAATGRIQSSRKHPARWVMSHVLTLATAASLFAAAAPASAQDQVIETYVRGRVDEHNVNYSNLLPLGDSGYYAGNGGQGRARSFFGYQLPTAPTGQKIVAARLRIANGPNNNRPTIYGGPQTVTLRNYTDVTAIENGTALFFNMGFGDVLGSRLYTMADGDSAYTEIQLNDEGLVAINANLGGKIVFSAKTDDTAYETYVWQNTSTFFNPNAADGRSQLIVTWGPDSSVPPTLDNNAPATMTPNRAPLLVNVDATGNNGATITGFEMFVLPVAVNGSGRIIDKSYSAQWTIDGNQLLITDSGGVGTVFLVFVAAIDSNGSVNTDFFTIEVVRKEQ